VEAGSSPARAFWQGAADALKLPAWMLGLSMVGVGPLARDVGFSIGGAVLSSLLIFAVPAQVVFFGMIAAGSSMVSIALAVTLSAVRLMPMTASLMPFLRGPGATRPKLLLASHFVAVTVWVESMRRLPHVEPALRRPYFFGVGAACMASASLFTALGYLLAGSVHPAIGAGLLFMTPTFFTLSLVAGARLPADWIAVGAGFLLPVIFGAWLGPAAALFLTGLLGGTAAFLVEMRRKAKHA